MPNPKMQVDIGRKKGFQVEIQSGHTKIMVWGYISSEGTHSTMEIVPTNSDQAKKLTLRETSNEEVN